MGCSEPEADARAAKRAARAEVLRRRAAMGAEARAQASAVICGKFLALPEYAAARTVMGFVPFGDEVDLLPALRETIAGGKRLALPRIDTDRWEIEARQVADLEGDCEPGYRGITEPKASTPVVPPSEIDLIAVPAVMVDADLRRLGYGGGFYDKFLAAAPQALQVGVVFEVQREGRVPSEGHDRLVGRCLTEAGGED